LDAATLAMSLNSLGRLISLSFPDLLIMFVYFVMVLGIGLYLRRFANTSNDFFMAGREMSAWVAGLSFLSANLGALVLMGWSAAAYQYGILAATSIGLRLSRP
jgi:SSS family solute:Na+ symporter